MNRLFIGHPSLEGFVRFVLNHGLKQNVMAALNASEAHMATFITVSVVHGDELHYWRTIMPRRGMMNEKRWNQVTDYLTDNDIWFTECVPALPSDRCLLIYGEFAGFSASEAPPPRSPAQV